MGLGKWNNGLMGKICGFSTITELRVSGDMKGHSWDMRQWRKPTSGVFSKIQKGSKSSENCISFGAMLRAFSAGRGARSDLTVVIGERIKEVKSTQIQINMDLGVLVLTWWERRFRRSPNYVHWMRTSKDPFGYATLKINVDIRWQWCEDDQGYIEADWTENVWERPASPISRAEATIEPGWISMRWVAFEWEKDPKTSLLNAIISLHAGCRMSTWRMEASDDFHLYPIHHLLIWLLQARARINAVKESKEMKLES